MGREGGGRRPNSQHCGRSERDTAFPGSRGRSHSPGLTPICPPSAMTGVGFVKDFLHVDSLEGRDWVIPACLVPGTSGGRADITSTVNVKG